jgi:predicted enzyme related to lactoylglutathione lyase
VRSNGVGSLPGVAGGAVVYVTDLRRMTAFYEVCFGMSMVQVDDEFCVLAADDWDLSLVSVPAAVAATFVITDPPRRREGSPMKLVFDVASIESLRPVVAARGGGIDPGETVWEFRGHRHLDCIDPEGNVVQMRQRVDESPAVTPARR